MVNIENICGTNEFWISEICLSQIYTTDILPRHLVHSFYGCVLSYRMSELLFNQKPVARHLAVSLFCLKSLLLCLHALLWKVLQTTVADRIIASQIGPRPDPQNLGICFVTWRRTCRYDEWRLLGRGASPGLAGGPHIITGLLVGGVTAGGVWGSKGQRSALARRRPQTREHRSL